MNRFESIFGRKPEYLFSAPGRTELGGNHTDHQHGKALAAAVTLDCRAQAAANDSGVIRVFSQGFGKLSAALNELEPVEAERGGSAALVRGIAAGFRNRGFDVRGFDACVSSDIGSGSGLSSSAAFEMLIASAINHISGCGLGPAELAEIGGFAENEYFGKPSGLMDQLASACGGVTMMDFADPHKPKLSKIDIDFSDHGYGLCIIDSGADHAGLTPQYAAVTEELGAICGAFGKKYLRDVAEEEFYARIAELRRMAGDRAVLRAVHIFDENRRVDAQAEALRRGDMEAFLRLVRRSGESSWRLLQNVIPEGGRQRQELAFALALCEHLLDGQGACRVHGGGFAGTVQAFVPFGILDDFSREINSVLGEGSCAVMKIRKNGAGLAEEY